MSKAWVLALLLACGALRAQEYSFRTFGSAEGLDNLAVRQIYQDKVGFLWVSTENGIFRYNGERFESFGPEQGIPSTSGAALGDAPDGTLLAGGSFGLYHLRGNRFERVPGIFKSVSWAQGIQADGKGHTFLGTDAGLMELYSEAGQDAFPARRIPQAEGASGPEASGILLDGDVLWYGCGLGLCRREAGGTHVYGPESGLPARTVMTIRKDRSSDLWVRVKNEGVFVLPAGETTFRRPDSPIAGEALLGIPALDADGRILLPSADGLLIRGEQGWRKIDRSKGLRGDVYAAFEDRQHSLWIGLAGRGLVRWQGYEEWESYSTASGLASDVVYEILPEPGGVLWAGTEGGLLRGKRGSFGMRWKKVAGMSGFPVHAVRSGPNGDLWMGTETRGAARLDKRTGTVKWFGEAEGLVGKAAYTLRFDREQRLWAATDAGLFVARAPYARFARVPQVPSARVWAIAEGSDGTIWVGGANGLFAWAGRRWSNFKHADGLSNQEVLSLGAGQQGTMWVGYRFGGGIDRVRLRSGALSVEKGIQRPGTDGLVYFLEFDAALRLWAGTEHGVDVWDRGHWSHLERGDGLVWNDCNLNAFSEEPDGTVWIGTSGGLSRFKPHPRSGPDVPIQVVFTRLLMGKTDVSDQQNPASGIHANSLIAGYSALNASRENGVLFRYRLVGAHSTWAETAERELQFAELAPGAYRLEIESQDGDGEWSGRRAAFAFRILTPWYMAWWFLLVCGLIPVLTGGGIVRLRMASVARRERELKRLMEAHEEIRNLAFYDPLTGLPNRRLLLNRLGKTLAASARTGRLRALLFVDLDDFKTLNDTLGHQTGDLLLQEVARRISATIRQADTVARLGGDEFVVMLEELSDLPEHAAAQAKLVGQKILAAVSEPYLLAGRECLSTSSVGITVFGDGLESTDEVLQQADIAMYQAKGAGRNTMRFFEPALQAAVNARAALEEDLRQAIKTGQFVLYYQPQVASGVATGAEALVRWKHPVRGILAPGEFIPLAEETGQILSLGDWVLGSACAQIAEWAHRRETAHLSIAVNISARQFRQPDFVERVLTSIAQSGANPGNLELELTESMLVDDIEDVIAKMTELKKYGLRFSLDDFGTGYASLSYLKRLPLNKLKIDRSFVRDILTDAGSCAIAQAVVSLSHAMRLSVLAEGVETEPQRELLARLGCHAFQGYLVSRPLPVDEFELLLAHAFKTPEAMAS